MNMLNNSRNKVNSMSTMGGGLNHLTFSNFLRNSKNFKHLKLVRKYWVLGVFCCLGENYEK